MVETIAGIAFVVVVGPLLLVALIKLVDSILGVQRPKKGEEDES